MAFKHRAIPTPNSRITFLHCLQNLNINIVCKTTSCPFLEIPAETQYTFLNGSVSFAAGNFIIISLNFEA